MKKSLIIILIVLGILLLCCAVSALTIMGKMPGLSSMLWKQKDLGVDTDPKYIEELYQEIGYIDNLRDKEQVEGEPVLTGSIALDRTFSQNEINSWANKWDSQWANAPFKNPQIKIHDDGAVEASAMISIEDAQKFAKQIGYSQEDIDKAMEYAKYLPSEIPVYARGTASVTNNEIQLNLDSAEAAMYELPSDITDGIEEVIQNVFKKAIANSGELDIQKAEIKNGKVAFLGTVPGEVDIKKDE